MWDVCDTVRYEFTGCWGNAIIFCLIAVNMMFSCELILEVMVVLGLTLSELMQCLRPPLELVQVGVQELVILVLVQM